MEGRRQTASNAAARRWPGSAEENLDRALVAGLLLELLLEPGARPADPQVCRGRIKARLKHSLVAHLAGQVSLDRFRSLVAKTEHWFTLYYPLIFSPPAATAPERVPPAPAGSGPSPLSRPALNEDLLRGWLKDRGQEILPQRPHRKLSLEKLYEFLCHTRGGWFRVKDFQEHFHVDRKTAWEYLQKLLAAGLLGHNRERSAAVRYCLETAFLLVQGEALRQEVGRVLAGLDPALAETIADWLIATGGEAFWEEEWAGRLEARSRRQVTSLLKAQGLLEPVYQAGSHRLLRLPGRWLQGSGNQA